MKNFILVLFLPFVLAAGIQLKWKAPLSGGKVEGYNIYLRDVSSNLTLVGFTHETSFFLPIKTAGVFSPGIQSVGTNKTVSDILFNGTFEAVATIPQEQVEIIGIFEEKDLSTHGTKELIRVIVSKPIEMGSNRVFATKMQIKTNYSHAIPNE